MSETIDRSATREVVDPSVIATLEAMTDEVLIRDRLLSTTDLPSDQFVAFHITKPSSPYDLNVYSLPEGFSGFNTGAHSDTDDNSRRWTVYIDRHTRFGAAFDDKGTVYAHGEYEPSHYHHNIRTGTIADLLRDFYDNNPHGTVGYKIVKAIPTGHEVIAEVDHLTPMGSPLWLHPN